jgi:hypothetical protein
MLRGGGKASRNLEFPRNFGIGRWSWEGDRLEDLRLVPGEAGNPGMRFRIPGIFQEHKKRTWMGSLRYRRFGVW